MRLIYRGLKKEVPGAEVSAQSIVRSAQPGIVGTWRAMSSKAAPGRVMSAFAIAMACTFGLSLLTGCASDDFDPTDSQQPTDSSLTYYDLPGVFSVNLSPIGASSTRAEAWDPGYNDGDENEYKFAPTSTASDGSVEFHHFMLVYGNSGNPITFALELPNKDEEGWELEGTTTDNITLTVKKVLSTGVEGLSSYKTPEEVANAINDKRAYFLINVNPSDFVDTQHSTGLASYSEAQLKAKVLKNYSIKVDDKDYFTMTSSTYVSGNNIISYSTISTGPYNNRTAYIYQTSAEAKAGTAVCTGYLDRLASKFTVDFSELNPSESVEPSVLFTYNPSTTVKLFSPGTNNGLIIDGSSYTIVSNDEGWQVDVLGYSMNGLEPNSYLLKKITKTAASGNNSYFSNWQGTFRTFWAEDPHYSMTSDDVKNYPMQFRHVLETSGVNVKHQAGGYNAANGKIDVSKVNSSYLSYYPFTYFQGKSGTCYTNENTYDDSNGELGERGYYSAGTHLIMVARLKINNVTSDDLYMDQNNIFYTHESQIIAAKLNILEKVVLNQANHGYKILETSWDTHQPINNNYTYPQTWEDYSLVWIKKQNTNTWQKATPDDFTLIEAELSGSDGQLFIAPVDKNATYCLAPAIDSQAETLVINESLKVDITYNRIISLFHKVIGLVDHFKNGYMYYPAGIPHHVKTIDKDSYKTVGDIGVVRNNWYNIQVTAINGIGRPVDNPDQPIIPNLDVKRDYLNMTVRILDWHTIEQSVPESSLETAS